MMILGTLFWYSIPQQMLSLERVRRAWRTVGLPASYLPRSRKPADVAAEACSTINRQGRWTFEQFQNGSSLLAYHVTRPKGEIVDLVFNKETASFASFDQQLLRAVERVYEQNSGQLPPHKQRQALRAYLLDSGAENFHGSLYFMPRGFIGGTALGSGSLVARDGLAILHDVKAMVASLYGEAAVFHGVPVHDTPDQLEYLRHAMDELLADEVDQLTKEVHAMLGLGRTRKWRSDRIETIRQRQQLLRRRENRFTQLVGQPLPRTREIAKSMDQAVADLVALTETPVIS